REETNLPDTPLSPEASYLKRKAEVTQRDHEDFLQYQEEKARQNEAAQARRSARQTAEAKPRNVNRRNFLTVVAGTAAVGEAAALGYAIKNQSISAHGARHAGDTYTEAQRHNIEREPSTRSPRSSHSAAVPAT